MTLQVQFITMISMIIGGFYLGIARDTYLRFSPYWRQRIFLRYFFEIAFWMGQTLLLFYVLYRVNAGELRVYVFIACMLGFSIYKVIFSLLYKRVLEMIIRTLFMIYQFCKKVIRIFIITPIRGILYLILLLFQFIISILFFVVKLIFIPIRWTLGLAFSLLPKKIQKIIRKLEEFYSIMKNTRIKWIKNILFKCK